MNDCDVDSRGERPLVTVVICAFNDRKHLRAAVASIIGQTYRSLEILVVDDGSTDGCLATIDDLDDPRIRVLQQPNRGKAAAMNLAMTRMRGEFFAIQDADDLSHPTRIERQLACMLEHPEVAATLTGYELLLGERRMAPTMIEKPADLCRRYIDAFCMPSHDPTLMVRRQDAGDLAFDESLRLAQGFDYILRLGERHPLMVVGACLYTYRVHAFKDPTERARFVRKALEAACARRGLPIDNVRLPGLDSPRRIRRRDIDNNLAAQFIESVLELRCSGQRRRAIRTALQCVALHPLDPHYYKALAYCVMPLGVLNRFRRARVPSIT